MQNGFLFGDSDAKIALSDGMQNEKGGNQRLLLLVELEYLRTYTLYDLQNRDRQAAVRSQVAVID